MALAGGASIVVQMDADWSHDPAALPSLIEPITADRADLVIGSRYTQGGGVEDWGLVRRIISRGGSLFARIVLGLRPHDLTGGFKAWRAPTLAAVPFDGVRAGGYVFQIEMTYRASRLGARVTEVPITFRDRRVGQSKMSRRIVVEALFVVIGPALGRAPRPGPGAAVEVTDAGRPGWRPGAGGTTRAASAGVRVVIDIRPIQDPERAPLTAVYLEQLLDGPRRRSATGRVVLVPARRRARRPHRPLAEPRDRGPAPPPADAAPALRGAHRGSDPAARRIARGGLASRA